MNSLCEIKQPGNISASCGCGSAGPLPILDLAGASIINPYSVASVTLNTECLKNPKVLIRVTALINAPIGVVTTLTFRVKKYCNDGCSQDVGGSYTASSLINLLSGKSFEFQICDCGTCCECCTYTLEISNATLLQAGTTVSAQITALAVEDLC